MLKKETNNWEVTIQDVVKINTDEGDTLLVSLPAVSDELPAREREDMFVRVASAFEKAFEGKKVKVLVVPHGMQVEIIKSSQLADDHKI